MSMTTIGTCSLCGGPVQVPLVEDVFYSPRPTCTQCGARASEMYGPVIEMVESRISDDTAEHSNGHNS